MTHMAYLAEPIDQHPGRQTDTPWGPLRDVVDRVAHSLDADGWGVYRPRTAFYVRELDPRVEQINRHALHTADVFVAILPRGVATIGVPAELEAATTAGIPAVVLHDGRSQALAGNRLVTVVDTPAGIPDAVRFALEHHPRSAVPDGALRLVIREGFDPPGRAYPDDAGIDLNTAIGVILEPGAYADVQTQVTATELPAGYWGLITGRSSTLRKRNLLVSTGVIDPGWRGPLFVGVLNPTDEPVQVKVGDRLGQLILIPNHPAPVAAVTAVSEHARGLNGFGSSGA